MKKFVLDSKVAKTHERNFYELPFEIKVSLIMGVSKRLYPLELSRSDLISPAKKSEELLKKFVLDSKVAKTHERNFYELPFEIKVSLIMGVSKRLYPLELSRSDLN